MKSNITSLSTSSSSNKSNNPFSTDNNLFSSGNDSDSVETKENGAPGPKTNASSKQVSTGAGFGGGGSGLFDDDEDEDFFSGKSLKASDSGEFGLFSATVHIHVQMGSSPFNYVVGVFIFPAAKDKPKPKKVIDLFDEDDEEGDIFSEKLDATAPVQGTKEVAEEKGNPPDKKVPKSIIYQQL